MVNWNRLIYTVGMGCLFCLIALIGLKCLDGDGHALGYVVQGIDNKYHYQGSL